MDDDLRDRVTRLEAAVSRLERLATTTRAPAATWAPPTVRPPTAPVLRATLPPPATPSTTPADLPADLPDAEAVLKWAGVALVVLALVFAVSTAIARGWVGPEVQLGGAMAVALGLVGVGVRLRPSRPSWTHALCAAGTFATFSIVASELFDTVAGPDAALATIVAFGLVALVLGAHVDSPWVGAAMLVGSLTAWFTVNADPSDVPGIGPFWLGLAWVCVAVGGTSLLAARRNWVAVALLADVAVLGVGPLVAVGSADRWHRIGTLVVLAGWLTSLARRPATGDAEPDPSGSVALWPVIHDHVVTVVPPWVVLVVVTAHDLTADRSIGSVAVVVAAAVGALVTVATPSGATLRPSLTVRTMSLVVGAGVCISIGLALVVPDPWWTTALAAQAMLLVRTTRTIGRDPKPLGHAAVLAAIVVPVALAGTLAAWVDDPPFLDDVAHLTVFVLIGIGAWWLGTTAARRIAGVGGLAAALIWFGSVLVHLPQGQAVVSISWAAIAIAVFVVGASRRRPDIGGAGLAVLAVTVAKLLTVDLAEVDTLWRAGLFLVIGLGILRLGFLLPRLGGDD